MAQLRTSRLVPLAVLALAAGPARRRGPSGSGDDGPCVVAQLQRQLDWECG